MMTESFLSAHARCGTAWGYCQGDEGLLGSVLAIGSQDGRELAPILLVAEEGAGLGRPADGGVVGAKSDDEALGGARGVLALNLDVDCSQGMSVPRIHARMDSQKAASVTA